MENAVTVKGYTPEDVADMAAIWNQVVEDGVAFPQEELLDQETAADFFAQQSWCGVAWDKERGTRVGLYILHPNNVGRCGHICNASYAVDRAARGRGVGRALVLDCMAQAKKLGFRILQFNAVVATNVPARRLYESLGFQRLGVIPDGFRKADGTYADICPYYITLH